ncbi:MAG: hypothetical protein JW783_05835 [Bacteroidales bacterium]|nr:hypothetical protein [Bacteroidales bacterium]MBN2748636.1 hypothetical protein [Bacteroidales bacterium]
MRTKYLLYTLCITFLLAGCDLELLEETDCANCYVEKPVDAYVDISVSINSENAYVPLEIYLGEFDKENLIYRDTSESSTYTILLEMNQDYSVVAKYYSKGRYVYVVNGEELRTKKDYDSCDQICYKIKGDKIDVRIKD